MVNNGSFDGLPILESFDVVGFDPRGVGQATTTRPTAQRTPAPSDPRWTRSNSPWPVCSTPHSRSRCRPTTPTGHWQRTPDGYESNIAESNKAITCLDAQVAPEPESALTLSAEGDGNEIEVTTSDDGTIDVTVTGSAEWTMSGTGEETDGTLVVTGTGTPAQGADVDAALIVDTNGCG